ncbi:hypothetical protein [Qipengyuania spongiae]|uniref:Transposase n=1 Tax=Qipengyuania spongiae TaxID=2909673 RepID=A0ABY5SUZ8_9SPHN|nr:hypothetical protein [Qipengyuania spongiae]UVI38372.1 hypothetical protein L1F33_08865 [Qipengyuania spongiae]
MMWVGLSIAHRAKAVQRMTALDRWTADDGEMSVTQAAADAGVGVTRFYEMGKAWRARRSLASLGTFASAPKSRVGKHDGAIRRKVGRVVAADPRASVRKLAIDLHNALGIPADEGPPSHNTLRRYVEEELRRREREASPGVELWLDCCACRLTPRDDVLSVAFVVLDRATQLVLGADLGDVDDSRSGYRGAARDALRRLDEGHFARLPWVSGLARAQIVVGDDEDDWKSLKKGLSANLGAGIELSTRSGRFGRYLRPATGLRIGTVVFAPNRTGEAITTGDDRPPLALNDRRARLAVEVDDYDARLLDEIDLVDEASRPPSNLLRFLERLATG